MKPGRLLEIWKQPVGISEKETEALETFTKDYPYFNLPYIILAKVYKDKQDFRYEDMMRQAALRSKDRQSLYAYLHQDDSADISVQKAEELTEPVESESLEPTVLTKPEEATLVVETEKDVVEIADKSLIENEDISEEKPIEHQIQPEEPDSLPEPVEPEPIESAVNAKSEEVDNAINALDNADTSLLEKEELAEANPEEIISEPDAQPEEVEKLPDVEEELVERELQVKPHSEKKPKKEVHTFDEWLNMFSHHENETTNAVVTETVKPKSEYKSKPVFKPKKKSNAPEAIALIEKFIEEKPSISKPKSTFFKAENAAKKSLEMDMSIATETLAKLFVKQGHPEKAIEIYQKLMLKFPKKERYFADLIEKLTLNNE